MIKIILLMLIMIGDAHALNIQLDNFKPSKKFSKKCDYVRYVPDGFGNFLAKNSDGDGKVVVLTDSKLELNRVQSFRYSSGKQKSFRKIQKLRYSGRANGFRQHWRDDLHTLADYPRKKVLFRGRMTYIDASSKLNQETGKLEMTEETKVLYLCFVAKEVDLERID